MSFYYMEHGKPEVRKYNKHGRTKQSYKDSCDINKLLEQGQREGSLSHLEKHGAVYGDYAAIDWDNLPLQLAEGQQVFNELPAELKKEFDQDPGKFFNYVTDPQNKDRLQDLLPAIAERGKFFPTVNTVQTRVLDENPVQTQAEITPVEPPASPGETTETESTE